MVENHACAVDLGPIRRCRPFLLPLQVSAQALEGRGWEPAPPTPSVPACQGAGRMQGWDLSAFFFFSGKACSTQTPQERRLSGCTSQMLTAGKWGQGSLKYEKWELGMRGNENWAPTPAAAWRGAACQHPRKQLTSLNPHFLIRAMRWQPHPHSPPPPPLRVESCAKPWGSPGPPGKLSSCRKLQPRGHFPTTAQQVARRRDSLETVP